ncbi:MAG: hypothetical protein JXA21_19650 [Anaerolineae bacterium]|nr:hypothetical protein [Anaerolineae bacterium]
MYIGVLAIPATHYTSALAALNTDRARAGYARELHFTELRNYSYAHIHNEKTLLARHWVNRVMGDDRKIFHFHLLGINLDNLQNAAFGEKGREQRRSIYNRFFHTAVAGTIKYFFGGSGVQVTDVFHDKENQLEQDSLFDWHAIWRIDQAEPDISFVPDRVEFIDSDHETEQQHPDDSHFIQLCDLLMGGFTQCLDARNEKDGCNEIATLLLPLAKRLTDPRQKKNPNSHYHHFRRISMSFFPSKRLTSKDLQDTLLRATSGFYCNRRLLIQESVGRQCSLDLWGIS